MLITAAVFCFGCAAFVALWAFSSCGMCCGGFSCYGAQPQELWHWALEHLGSLVAVCRLSCSMACEILVYSHLSTTTRDWIHVPCIGRWILKHCTTKEVLQFIDLSVVDVTSWFCCCQFSSVQSLSCVQLCDPMDCSTPGSLSITNTWSLLRFMSIKSVMPSNHLILCHPRLFLPSIFPSISIFSNELVLRIR